MHCEIIPPVEKRQRAAALQKLAPIRSTSNFAKRLGLRQPSGALRIALDLRYRFHDHRSMPASRLPWPHAPTHQLSEGGTYFVTASTYRKAHHFSGADRLRVLHRGLLTMSRKYGWLLEAWAVFSNHYHFVAHSPVAAPDASSIYDMLSTLQVRTSEWVNRLDHARVAAFGSTFAKRGSLMKGLIWLG